MEYLLNVKLLTIIQSAAVRRSLPVIHSCAARQFVRITHLRIVFLKEFYSFLRIILTWTIFLAIDPPRSTTNPCQPSPCGPNSRCLLPNNAVTPSCLCNSGFVGSPPNCRPECINNDECGLSLACINQKCRDPCQGSCGANSECHVVNHTPMCNCIRGYIGDPFIECSRQPCEDT